MNKNTAEIVNPNAVRLPAAGRDTAARQQEKLNHKDNFVVGDKTNNGENFLYSRKAAGKTSIIRKVISGETLRSVVFLLPRPLGRGCNNKNRYGFSL